MKISLAIVFIAVSSPWFIVGGAPPQVEPSRNFVGGAKNATLGRQRDEDEAGGSLALQQARAGNLGRGETVVKNSTGISRGDDHGKNSTIPIISHPITDPDLQSQLNELRSYPEAGELNRKEDKENGGFLLNPEEDIQTITLDKEYTPQDIAEYIFWTGDERGVAMAISDLLNDGLMLSQDDVIKFLENVKSELDYLRSRYEMSLSRLTSSSTPEMLSPVKESDFLRPRGHDKLTSSYSNEFGSKFQTLLQQQQPRRNNKELEQRDSDLSFMDFRNYNKRRIPSPSSPQNSHPHGIFSGAYDHHHNRLIPEKKNRGFGPTGHYFSENGLRGRVGYDNNNIQFRNNHNNAERNGEQDFLLQEMRVKEDRLSLQEIIYNLARELFSRNLKQSTPEDPEWIVSSGGDAGIVVDHHHRQRDRLQEPHVSPFIQRKLIPDRTPKAIEEEVRNILDTALLDSTVEEQRRYWTRNRRNNRRVRREINSPFISSARYLRV